MTRAFRQHAAVKPLLAYAKANGYRVLLGVPRGDWAFGWISQENKTIMVYTRESNGRFRCFGDMLFVLAHEVRHLQHVVDGLYRAYYDDRPRARPKDFITAIGAERDCDRYAKSYLRKHYVNGTTELVDRKYPTWRVDPRFLKGRALAHRNYIDVLHEVKRRERLRRLRKSRW